MTARAKLGWRPLLGLAMLLLGGCPYYACKDELVAEYTAASSHAQWIDERTLEIRFAEALRDPEEVDPWRFALLRYHATIVDEVRSSTEADPYSYVDVCEFELCYETLDGVTASPESLSWDPARPKLLRLHFPEPLSASACEPWAEPRADYQALALIHLGYPDSDPAPPEELAYADDRPVEAVGPEQARRWLGRCGVWGLCKFEGFCVSRYGPDARTLNLWVDCP